MNELLEKRLKYIMELWLSIAMTNTEEKQKAYLNCYKDLECILLITKKGL